MKYLTVEEVLYLHKLIIKSTGGCEGIREIDAIKTAVDQPHMTFDNVEFYKTLAEKAAALCHSLVLNHPFVDGNKRIGHAAMESFLVLNGFEIIAPIDDAEEFFLNLAAGAVSREQLTQWIIKHQAPLKQ